MPATTIPFAPHQVPPPLTKEDRKYRACCLFRFLTALWYFSQILVEWADLPIIDLSKASTPEGRAELAPQVRDAMRTYGFFYIVNHGYTQAQA